MFKLAMSCEINKSKAQKKNEFYEERIYALKFLWRNTRRKCKIGKQL